MKKLLLVSLLLLLNLQFVLGVTVNFNVYNSESEQVIQGAVVVLNGLSDPSFSRTQVTDSNGEAVFSDVPGFAYYSFVVVHDDFESYSNVVFSDVSKSVNVPLVPVGEFAWDDVYFSDGNMELTWYSTDDDIIYDGGERMNHVTITTNIRDSGYLTFDAQTHVLRFTQHSHGSPTDWNSVHSPQPGELLELKPGGWVRSTFKGNTLEMCVGKAIVYYEGIAVELMGQEYICIEELRNENVVPYYLDGDFYINTTATYKIGSTLHYISAISQNFTINNDDLSVNHPPLLNVVDNEFIVEGETVIFDPIAIDPDNDELTVSVDDSRFNFIGRQDNSFVFQWHTHEGDSGIYEVGVTVSDGEFEVTSSANVSVLKQFTLDLNNGLNLVSLPFNIVTSSIYSNPLFNDSIDFISSAVDLKNAYVYNSEGDFFYLLDKLVEGVGMWFDMGSADSLTITGLNDYPVSFNLKEGLNLIG